MLVTRYNMHCVAQKFSIRRYIYINSNLTTANFRGKWVEPLLGFLPFLQNTPAFPVDLFPLPFLALHLILEIGLGILLFLNTKYAKLGALGVFYLMLLFLPVHIWDVFSATPAIGSHTAALIRLPFQFLFIAWAWKIHKEISSSIAIRNN